MNGQQGRINDYRRILQPILTNAAYQVYRINPHPQSALSLERIVFASNAAAATIKTGDYLRVFILFSQSPTTILAGQFVIIGEASWLVPGTAGTAVYGANPPGDIGLELSPALRLAPSDDPVFIFFRDEGVSGGGGGGTVPADLYAVVSGWEIPTKDLATFPPPDSVEAVI